MVMSREAFEDECLRRGMNQNSFYQHLSYSPIIVKHAEGVYGLRGAKILPGTVSALIQKKRREKVLHDFGWTDDGKVWIALKISKAMCSTGIFTVPQL